MAHSQEAPAGDLWTVPGLQAGWSTVDSRSRRAPGRHSQPQRPFQFGSILSHRVSIAARGPLYDSTAFASTFRSHNGGNRLGPSARRDRSPEPKLSLERGLRTRPTRCRHLYLNPQDNRSQH